MTTPRPIEEARTPSLHGSWPALLHATLHARALAAQTGTALMVLCEGAIEHLYPTPPPQAAQVGDEASDYGEQA